MDNLKNFIDGYLNINKNITLAVLTLEHDDKKDVDQFLHNLTNKLTFDHYKIARKGTQFSIISTLVLVIDGKYSTERVTEFINLSSELMRLMRKENIFLLHRDVYIDDMKVTHPLAQMQISYAVLIVREHLKLNNVL